MENKWFPMTLIHQLFQAEKIDRVVVDALSIMEARK